MLARLNIIVRAHARIRISMRMHTYTRAYVIYKVARDRVITWCEDTVFCIFCIYVSQENDFCRNQAAACPQMSLNIQNSGFDGQYVRQFDELNKTKKNYKKHQKTLYKKISKDYYMQAVVSSKQVSNCGASPKQTQHFEMKKVLKKT